MSDQEFQIGEKAVVPNQGVGVIKEIETLKFGVGLETRMYVIKLLDNGGTYRCPVGKAAANNVRDVMPAESIPAVYEVLADRDKPADKQTWNRRYREYMNKIKTGDALEVAKVLRDLALLKSEKALSFGERKMFDQARTLLVQEVAMARDEDEKIVGEEIDALFAYASQPRTPAP